MSIKTLTHRFIKLFVFILALVFIITSCDLGDNNPNYVGTTGYNLIGTQIIGTTGGEINLDSIIVKVPSGAFDDNNEVNIYAGVENDGFDEYGSSALYQIDGLPSTINKPVKLSIKYHGTIEGDTLVAIGTMGFATSLDSSLYSYHTENASDSAGYLVYDIPANSGLGKLTQPQNGILDGALNIIVLSSYVSLPSSNGHFKLSFPLPYYQQAVLMGEHFETAYSTCHTMGFSYAARTSWPVNVLTKPLGTLLYGSYSYKISSPNGKTTVTNAELRSFINRGKFTINLNILSDDLKLRTVCGHEFLHLVQNLYEFSAPNIEQEQNWLKEATSVWIEDKFANVTDYVSSIIPGRELYLFDGWQIKQPKPNNYETSHAETGYGLSVIIKALEDRYGETVVVKLFEKIKSGILPNNPVDPVDAILSVLNEPVSTFWHGVLSSYVLGQYYNSNVNFRFLDTSDADWYLPGAVYYEPVIIDKDFTIKHDLRYRTDLSGSLYKVKAGDLSGLDKVPLSFKISDPINCGLLICKFKKGQEISELGNVFPGGTGEVIVSDAKPIFDDGYEIIVLVSNSTHNKNENYQDQNGTTLSIELKEVERSIEKIDVFYTVDNAIVEWTWEDGTVSYKNIHGYSFYSDAGTSILSNNVYNTTWDNDDLHGDILNGNMNITFLNDPRRVDVHVNLV